MNIHHHTSMRVYTIKQHNNHTYIHKGIYFYRDYSNFFKNRNTTSSLKEFTRIFTLDSKIMDYAKLEELVVFK